MLASFTHGQALSRADHDHRTHKHHDLTICLSMNTRWRSQGIELTPLKMTGLDQCRPGFSKAPYIGPPPSKANAHTKYPIPIRTLQKFIVRTYFSVRSNRKTYPISDTSFANTAIRGVRRDITFKCCWSLVAKLYSLVTKGSVTHNHH